MDQTLSSVLKQITEQENLAKEFAELDNMDEMYSYCREFDDDYTQADFYEDANEMMKYYPKEMGNMDLEKIDFSRVGGGVNAGLNNISLGARVLGGFNYLFNK